MGPLENGAIWDRDQRPHQGGLSGRHQTRAVSSASTASGGTPGPDLPGQGGGGGPGVGQPEPRQRNNQPSRRPLRPEARHVGSATRSGARVHSKGCGLYSQGQVVPPKKPGRGKRPALSRDHSGRCKEVGFEEERLGGSKLMRKML